MTKVARWPGLASPRQLGPKGGVPWRGAGGLPVYDGDALKTWFGETFPIFRCGVAWMYDGWRLYIDDHGDAIWGLAFEAEGDHLVTPLDRPGPTGGFGRCS